MTKGTINAVKKVDAVSQPRRSDLEGQSAVPSGTTRVRRKAEQAKRPEGQHVNDHNDAGTTSRSGTPAPVRNVSGTDAPKRTSSKRLTAAAEDRLRQAKRANRTIGELADEYDAEQKAKASKSLDSSQQLAIKSYNSGYNSGFEAGIQDERGRVEQQELDDAPDRVLRFWQATTILTIGILIGMLIPR